MDIEFLICTIDARITQVEHMLLEPQPGVSYLISWQRTGEGNENGPAGKLPAALLSRSDVRVVTMQGGGLSRNRNNALSHARGDLLVIADDDCRYSAQSMANIRKAFALHSDAAVVQMQCRTPEGRPLHSYQNFSYEYRQRPRFTFFSSCELVLRRAAALPQFDERFGVGAYLGCGEEEVFLHEASRRGLAIYYEPLPLAVTPGATTGTHFRTSKSVQRAKGGLLTVIHGPLQAFFRCLKYAICHAEGNFQERCGMMCEMTKGIRYVCAHHTLP